MYDVRCVRNLQSRLPGKTATVNVLSRQGFRQTVQCITPLTCMGHVLVSGQVYIMQTTVVI